MYSRRSLLLAAISLVLLFAIYRNREILPHKLRATPGAASTAPEHTSKLPQPQSYSQAIALKKTLTDDSSPLSPEVLNYFDQAFSVDKPHEFDFPALQYHCDHTTWREDDIYLKCGGMAAGLTSIISQVKVCMKMAVEAGIGLVLPSMPLRDSNDLKEFNFLNGDAYLPYDQWFDGEFLIESLGRICPKMKIIHPSQVDSIFFPVKREWGIDIGKAPGYRQFYPYFWVGKPFKSYFDSELTTLQNLELLDPNRDDTKQGITVVAMASNFLLFRVTDDPTGQDTRLWSDLSHLIRFKEEPRKIVANLLEHLARPFYGVHFRVENDTIWSSLENQLAVDLDALDQAWAKYGQPGQEKPLVYLACGDQQQVDKFVKAGKERGWEVTHKWALAQNSAETLQMINDLAFDFQGAVDMGIMIRSHFFLGITGSAFSSTISNSRDTTGRYRGSSLYVFDDGNARTHLFNDGDAGGYPCCL